ncbi:DUF222 domain-containing protein [Rhodococcus sp. NCIMB 12038]|uniref:DUF222 domain-containing protein n=1 Tax=Rhodococcus sp. NCIMB 12038 TaxID=933800 RepID=UPI00117A78B3
MTTPPGILAIDGLRMGRSMLVQAHHRRVMAVALGVNDPVVTPWIDLGLDLRHRLHGTRDAFAAGRIDLDQARVIARYDPDSIVHRNKLAIADRDVWIRPAENGMAYLDGHLPAADAHTLAMRLREMSV